MYAGDEDPNMIIRRIKAHQIAVGGLNNKTDEEDEPTYLIAVKVEEEDTKMVFPCPTVV